MLLTRGIVRRLATHPGGLMTVGPIDLIHLEGEGNSFILRITGKLPPHPELPPADVLDGEFVVDTAFVRGSLNTWVFVSDLVQWRDALDALDAGQDIAWREETRGPSLYIDHDPDHPRLHVTIKDDAMSLTTLTVGIPLVDSWFDEAYERLDQVWKTWLPDVDGSA